MIRIQIQIELYDYLYKGNYKGTTFTRKFI